MKFHNREMELAELERVWKLSKKSAHLTLISGRRRVGKTELVKKFISDKPNLYFFVGRKNLSLLLEEFSSISKQRIEKFPTIQKFDEWLDFLLNSVEDGTIICFDEFQNFKYVDESVFSDFQKIFDAQKTKLKVHIIVTGSHVSLINKIFSDEKESLFGRATEKYTVKPLLFHTISEILSELSIKKLKERVEWYCVFGGIPKYYVNAEEQGLKGKDILSALNVLLLRDFAPLKDEARNVLIEEFGSENSMYFSILEAVALGNSEMSTIANKTGINIKSISKYLGLLVKDFNYLHYEVPVTEDKPWKSKKGRYFINDNFFRFWFKYVYRNRSEYEIGNYDMISNKILLDFNSFVGNGFEQIAKEALIAMNNKKKLPFELIKVGRWWARDKEIDLLGLNSSTKEALFVECKWQEDVDAQQVLEELKEKAQFVEWNKNKRTEYYAIFAKGFKKKISEKNVLLFDFHNL
ncbi:MAG: ATP-binding protein [Nanoarchaeota archaeon]